MNPNGRPVINLIGQRFGRLTVIERAGSDKRKESIWRCQCKCGGERLVLSSLLRDGRVTSCGCARVENSRDLCAKHGWYGSPEYRCWQAMKARCYRPTCKGFVNCGGRGIKMDPAWRDSFAAFLEGVGMRPSPRHHLFRIDLNDHFRADNCEWGLQAGRFTRGHL